MIPQRYTTILVKDENKGDVVGTFSLADLGMGGGMKSNLDNEIEN
jgi:hypothetical protein